jgi:hypothetical protein
METSKVKVGMRVVPHNKTFAGRGLNDSNVWNYQGGLEQRFLYVTKKTDDFFTLDVVKDSNSGDYFNASDFEPYIEPKAPSFRIKSGRKHGNQYTIQLADGRKGESPYNSEQPYLSVLEAFCKATNTPTDIVDMLFSQPQEAPTEPIAEPVTFEVGETVRISPSLSKNNKYEIFIVDQMLQYAGKIAKITREFLAGFCLDIDGGAWNWSADTLEKIPQPAKL